MVILGFNMAGDNADDMLTATIRPDNNHRRLAPAPATYDEIVKK